MEALRALCGDMHSTANLVASIVNTRGLSLDVNEFKFASSILELMNQGLHQGEVISRKHQPAVIRYVVEMCDWSDISGSQDALSNAEYIFGQVMVRVSKTEEPLHEELRRTLQVFTREVVQRIQDIQPRYNLVRTLFVEEGLEVSPALAHHGLTVIPDSVLFDVRVTDDDPSGKNTIETPILEMFYDTSIWNWEVEDETNINRKSVLDFLKVCLDRMPERGFLSKKVKVAPGKYQYVLHTILANVVEITTNHQHCYRQHYLGPVSEVLRLLFQTLRLQDDIRSIKRVKSSHYLKLGDEPRKKWNGLTLEDMVRMTYPDLLPILATTTTKGAFDE